MENIALLDGVMVRLRMVNEVRASHSFQWPECPFQVGSYHSWLVDGVPDGWKPTAR